MNGTSACLSSDIEMQHHVPGDALEDAISHLQIGDLAAASLRSLAALPSADISHLPLKKTGAVLVLLYVDEEGQLCLPLTTRALTLRTSPGETALPGGRHEDSDISVQETALREAFEEVSLPRDTPLVHLTTMAPFLSYTLLTVVPVVYLLNQRQPESTVIAKLQPSPSEVSAIFTARLSGFLGNERAYAHTYHDVPWLQDKPFRLHEFRDETFASDVTGLTADILLTVAQVAAGQDVKLGFDRMAPEQMSWSALVQHVLDGNAAKRRAK